MNDMSGIIMAHMELIIGPMYSGKSTELIRRCNKYEAIQKRIVIFNHIFDTRCENNSIQTHSKTTKEAIKTQKLIPHIEHIVSYDIIAIDEAQFFDDLFEFLIYIERLNKVVIVAGLDGDSHRKPFGQILNCIPLMDRVTKLNAMCMVKKDGSAAAFTKKLDPNNLLIDIGSTDKYISVCREKYLE